MAKKQKRKYVFQHKSPTEHYVADAYTVRCVDNRFWKAKKRFIKHLGLKHIDPKSPAGGAKVFVSPQKESDIDRMFRELEISIRLHHVKRVMLFNHHDCGAYGGFKAFDNDSDKELAFHKVQLKKAAKVVKNRFPDLKVETYFIDDEGVIKVS